MLSCVISGDLQLASQLCQFLCVGGIMTNHILHQRNQFFHRCMGMVMGMTMLMQMLVAVGMGIGMLVVMLATSDMVMVNVHSCDYICWDHVLGQPAL